MENRNLSELIVPMAERLSSAVLGVAAAVAIDSSSGVTHERCTQRNITLTHLSLID